MGTLLGSVATRESYYLGVYTRGSLTFVNSHTGVRIVLIVFPY